MSAAKARRKAGLSQFLQTRRNLKLAQIMPIQVFRLYLNIMGFLYYWSRKSEWKEATATITTHINNGNNPIQKLRLVYNIYNGILEHYLEKFIITTRSPSEMAKYLIKNCEIRDTKWLDLVEVSGKGGILATGHFGASEFIPALLALHGYRVAAVTVYRSDHLRRIAKKRARFYDIWLIDAGQVANSFLEFAKAIRDGRILVVAFDEIEHWVPSKNCSISIFGERFFADKGLDLLQRRTSCAASLGILRRRDKSETKKYTLHIHPIPRRHPESSISAEAWGIFERYIKRYPEQWYKWNDVAKGLAQYRLKQ